jgi:hypothetical protein
MFVLSRNVSASFRVIATLVATAVVLWAMGAYHYAQAANITDVYDLLTDSDRGVVSNHTISFVSPTGITNGQTATIDLTGFTNAGGVDFTDIDVATATDYTVATDCSGAAPIAASFAALVLTINFCTGDGGFVAAGGTTTIQIGTNATFGVAGNAQLTNPATAGSYEIDIAGTMADSGHTRVAILDDVLVTASVLTSFDFTVIGNPATTTVNGTTTTRSASSTTIPFGTLTANEIETLAQDLTVETNAINGFVVTVQESQHLLSSTGADIDNFDDSVISGTPAAWNAPANSIGNENTWGHWGVTSEDTATTRSVQFASNQWVGVSTTPIVLFSHTGPADGTTPGVGSTTVGYQVQITALQEAGDDYNTTLTYIATPTF